MKLALFDNWRVGVVDDDRVFDVTESVPGWKPAWPYAWMLSLIEDIHNRPDRWVAIGQRSPSHPLQEVRLRAPVPMPSKIVAAPVNYRRHQQEMGGKTGVYQGANIKTIQDYGLFIKPSSSIIGPGEAVTLPFSGRRTDHEAEIGVVIGKTVKNVSEEAADDAIFGLTCLLDLTVRGGEDRPFRKGFDGFTPIGPWIATSDTIPDLDDVHFRFTVNGDVRQESSTAHMIYSIRRLVALASYQTTLYPGDIIASGTPEGVGEIRPGDHLQLDVEHVGQLNISVASEWGHADYMGPWFNPFLSSRAIPQ
ncbi:fumarylacetoacetate hydrolase family protein [Sulfobacillus harzensis]|uniref:Fumarylacetoacetate hydrolase family protein n=1 Tax=Sulfobacillus harzensis TaxID=2729629 RepID=A0A7Y0L723_9FIRM|nr:fumarylacetoacetate hydrolase family protein [Sulfobacillus harzensis]NMP24127.1 fumarylacetoacetate hydrolase family protein [Sulfobacillus harzensis]